MKLYEIAEEYKGLIDMSIDTEDDVQAFRSLMDAVQGDFDAKAENYCKVIRSLEAEAEAIKAEKLYLEKRQKTAEKKAQACKEYFAFLAKQFLQDGEKKKVGIFSIGFKKNPPALVVEPWALITDYYYKKELDKAKLKDDVKNGVEIKGVRLEQGESFQII
jgi:hypothetical protein